MNQCVLKKPELLSPAGNWASLISAVKNGADSVYFGIKGLNMRAFANNFELSQIESVMDYLHQQGKKGYVALNTIIMDDQWPLAQKILHRAKNADVDSVILWDMGALNMAAKLGIKVHLSTQASVANIQSVKFFHQLGVKRIVLARECTLEQIREIKNELLNKQISCEIETFIHGAMCLSISGRCFMSKYTHDRSANQGECTQPCRREYEITAVKGSERFIVGKDYVMSPKDLCTIDFLDELIESKVDSLKIEGRMRSPDYSAVVTSVYRRAIDAYFTQTLTEAYKNELKQELTSVYNRGFSNGFYFGEPQDSKSYRLEQSFEKIYIAEVKNYYKEIKVADILIRNMGIKAGETVLVFGKKTPASYALIDEIQQAHRFVDCVVKGERAGIKIPFKVNKGDKVFLWRKRSC